MSRVNAKTQVCVLLLGASSALLSAAVQPQTSGSASGDECTSLEATDYEPPDSTCLLQTGTSRLARSPPEQEHQSLATKKTIAAMPSPSLSGVKGTSFVQTGYFTQLNRTQMPVSDPSRLQEPQTTVDAQERTLSALITFAQDTHRNPYTYMYRFNATSGKPRYRLMVDTSQQAMMSPLIYIMVFLLVLVVAASLYLDTLEHKRDMSIQNIAHQDPKIPVESMLGSSLHPKGLQGSRIGLTRHNLKLPADSTATGLLEDADPYTPKAERGPYAGVCKGGSFWEAVGYNVLARLPGLHTFGGAVLLLVIIPRVCPTEGLILQMTLLLYGALKFIVAGFWTAHGLWMINNQENYGLAQDAKLAKQDAKHAADCAAGGIVADNEVLTAASVLHCVVIPCYKEAASTIGATLQTLSQQTVARQIVVVLAMEARDEEAQKTAQDLTEEFQSSGLAAIFYTLHELRGSETPGKSSNENWAFRCIKRWLCDKSGFPLEQAIFTTCDADTYFHPHHFEYLSNLFLKSDAPHRSVWQGAICALPNSYDLPALTSVRYIMLTLGYLGQLANDVSLCGNFPLGIYSMSAKLAHEVGYWDPTVVPEDWHMFFKVNLESSGGGVKCVPMYTVVGNLGVEGSTYWESLKGCYKQSVRWQWGGISMGYLLMQFFQSKCPLWKRLLLVLGHYEHHFLLPLVWLSAVSLPILYGHNCIHEVHPNFSKFHRAVEGEAPPTGIDGVFPYCGKGTVSIGELSVMLWACFLIGNWIAVIVLEWWYRSIVNGRTHFERVPQGRPSLWRAITFMFFPLTDVVFHVVPTWHAYLKMFFSTGFEYEVAAKGGLPMQEEAKASSGVNLMTTGIAETQSGRL